MSPPEVSGWWRALFGARGSVLLLISDSDGSHLRLWSGDGSGTDWVEIHDFGPRSWFGEVVPGDEEALIVVAEEGRGEGLRLYRTDGTAAGTAAILDLAALGLGEAYGLTPVGGQLFFAAGSVGGIEPWVSDGTQEGTRRLQEIAPGPPASQPGPFTRAGSRLYFTADDGLHGRELWSLPLDGLAAPCRPSTTGLCLGDGRFRAELFLHDRSGWQGDGRAVPWSSTSGAFWLYGFGNPEAVVKMVDGGAINDRFWLFATSLTHLGYTLRVTETETGTAHRYVKPAGEFSSVIDLSTLR